MSELGDHGKGERGVGGFGEQSRQGKEQGEVLGTSEAPVRLQRGSELIQALQGSPQQVSRG